MKRRCAIVALILLVFGAARLPYEAALGQAYRESFFHGAKLDLSLREEISQMSYLAALSGFRSLVADALWIQAHSAWERTEWGRMARLFNNVTALQPRAVMFWDLSAWHMAWNASVHALEDPEIPTQALRRKAQREYFDLGRDFLDRGIRNNPDRWFLHMQMGRLLEDKYKDACGAAEAYAKAATFEDAPAYVRRFAAYQLAACPGHEETAYRQLRELYLEDENNHLPTLLRLLGELQEKLDVPTDQRVYNPRG